MTHARWLVVFVCTLLGACWHPNELVLSYRPAPLTRVRTETPVLDDSTRKHLSFGDVIVGVRGCSLPADDSLPQVPVQLRGLCATAKYPQSDP
jgi:hypothetical protein